MDLRSSSEGSVPSVAEEVEVCTPVLQHSEAIYSETDVAPPILAIAKASSTCVTTAPTTAEQIPDLVASESLQPTTLATRTKGSPEDAKTLEGDRSVTPRGDDGTASDGHTEVVLIVGNKEEPTKAEGISKTASQHSNTQEEAGRSMGAMMRVTTSSEGASLMKVINSGKVDAARTDVTCVRNNKSRTSPQENIAETEAMDFQNAKERKVEQHQVILATGMTMPCEDLVHHETVELSNKVEPSRENDPILLSRTIDLQVTSTDTPASATDIGLNKDEDLAPKEAKAMEITDPLTKKHCPIEAVKDKEQKDGTLGDDEKTAMKTPKDARLVQSVPPHMHLTSKSANVQPYDPPNTRREWPAPGPRGPRAYYPSGGHQPSRLPLDYDELQRTKAQLSKTRNNLDCERNTNAETQKTDGAEKQASIDAAMSNMLTDLLHKQAEALTEKAKVQEKERDLHYRERRIVQLEEYLSDGQRQLKYQLEQQGIRPMSVVEQANLRRELEIKVRHQLSDIEGNIAIQEERLRNQEAAQKIREQQYKAWVCDAVEAEVRVQIAKDEQDMTADTKAAEVVCERSLAQGQHITGDHTSGVTLEQEFLKGYAACSRSQIALYNMRSGLLATDSPELAFLYDLTHPENLHNIGVQIGRMEDVSEKVKAEAMEANICHKSAKDGEPQAVVAHRGRGQAKFNNAGPLRSTQTIDHPEKVHDTQRSKQLQEIQKEQQEQPLRNSVPQRSTFAGELRGSSVTSKAIFAGCINSPSSSDGQATIYGSIGNGTTKAGSKGSVGEGVYAGRRIVRYEQDSDVEPASPNLIDLY
ncbi:uncharacterized protein EKO05_0002911 [Ascochyta rabiei]|nr:uncharacterized protein EKO05_0002911 [Ascochyta rabiei]UPX12361.1 hypothetical protein EKO05_0002911 [Ascochyta rabiei]